MSALKGDNVFLGGAGGGDHNTVCECVAWICVYSCMGDCLRVCEFRHESVCDRSKKGKNPENS